MTIPKTATKYIFSKNIHNNKISLKSVSSKIKQY